MKKNWKQVSLILELGSGQCWKSGEEAIRTIGEGWNMCEKILLLRLDKECPVLGSNGLIDKYVTCTN